MGEKQPIKIRLSTALFIIALIVIAVMGYYIYTLKNNTTEGKINNVQSSKEDELQNKIEELEEKLNDTTIEQNTTDKEFDKVEESNTIKNASVTANVSKDDKYTEIKSNLGENELFYITEAIKNSNNTYTLKGVLYDEYTLTKSELDKCVKSGKITICGEKYNIKPKSKNEYSITIDNKRNEEYLSVKKRNDDTYYLESGTEFSTVYKLTNTYKQITVESNLKCEYLDEYGQESIKTTVNKFFKDFKYREPVDTTNPSGVFELNLKNGKCTGISEVITGR